MDATHGRIAGEYRAGYYYSTSNARDVLKGSSGQPALISGAAYRSASSKHGMWVGAMQQVAQHAGDAPAA